VTATAVSLPRRFASLVKLEHTVFALPFAYVGMLLALGESPSASDWLWVTVAMVVTLLILATYAALLVLRHEGWRGRRAALLHLAGFALVAIVLPLTHFAS